MIELIQRIFLNQLSLINKTIDDVKNDIDFYHKNKLTRDQYNSWYDNSLQLLINEGNLSELEARKKLDLIDISYGLLYEYHKQIDAPEYIDDLIIEIRYGTGNSSK